MLLETDAHISPINFLCSSSAYAHVKLDNCPNLWLFLCSPDETQSKCYPFGGSHSANKLWHADSHPLAGRFTLFARRCLTNLSGVPSVGQSWECIKTVKMAAVTVVWHSLHLGVMSEYDIAAFCPKKKKKKIVISLLKPTAGPLQLLLVIIFRHPPASVAVYTWLCPATSAVSQAKCSFSASRSHPSVSSRGPPFPLSPLARPSLLFLAGSDLF